ncbi:phage holin family protein [Candidatus Peregrinibacteria bacterium]|jgi:putative membrane protein|nr:phage holin family protein [Candidatus Peregrinibacteria bacterium]MBT4148347.1 phage holin family protein [Candidatus Peregrinibacteria bacterium]MBT4366686.1 phage holin family protein [Candidatus Peregrinibacteria bacterium]MBT4455900.1 phage holin family protein [Candidatus Peregrinibacteria bacterium]
MMTIYRIIIGILVNAGALYAVTEFVDGVTYTGGITFFIIGGILVGLINAIAKPVIKVLSLPFIFITGGLFLIVINAGVLWFLSYFLGVIEFRDVSLLFPNLGSYAIGAVVFGLVNFIENLFLKKRK